MIAADRSNTDLVSVMGDAKNRVCGNGVHLFVLMLPKRNDFMENTAVPTTIMKASILLYQLVTGTVSTEMQHHSYLLLVKAPIIQA